MYWCSLLSSAEDRMEPLRVKWTQYMGGDIVQVQNLDEDPNPEIVLFSISPTKTYVYGLDYLGNIKWRSMIPEIWSHNEIHLVRVDELDGNHNLDYVISSRIRVKDRTTSPFYLVEKRENLSYHMLRWSNVDHPRAMDIITFGTPPKTIVAAFANSEVYALNPEGQELWHYSSSNLTRSLYAGDIDGDGRIEIVGGGFGIIYVLDDLGKVRWTRSVDKRIIKLTAAPVYGSNNYTIFSVSEDEVIAYDNQGNLVWKTKLENLAPVIGVGDLEGRGKKDILTLSKDYVITALNPNGSVHWEYDVGKERIQGLVVHDLEGDGRDEVVAYSPRGLVVYELNPSFPNYERALKFYKKAVLAYRQKNYTLAIDYATQAYDIYSKINYTHGVALSKSILNRSMLYLQANELIINASRAFNDSLYEQSLGYYKKAYGIYLILNDTSKLYSTRDNVERLEKYVNATIFFKQAQKAYLERNYPEGKRLVNKSLSLFLQLGDQKWISKAKILSKNAEEYLKADSYYQEARNYFEKGRLETSKKYIQQALDIYNKLGDKDSVERLKRFSDKIEILLEKKITREEAESNLLQAEESYDEGKWAAAKDYAEKALSIYKNLQDKEGEEKALALVKQCEEKLRKEIETKQSIYLAKAYLHRAQTYVDENKLTLAKEFATYALQEYQKLGDNEGVVRAKELLKVIEEKIALEGKKKAVATPSTQSYILYILGAVAVFAVIALAVLIILYRKKAAKPKTTLSHPPGVEAKPSKLQQEIITIINKLKTSPALNKLVTSPPIAKVWLKVKPSLSRVESRLVPPPPRAKSILEIETLPPEIKEDLQELSSRLHAAEQPSEPLRTPEAKVEREIISPPTSPEITPPPPKPQPPSIEDVKHEEIKEEGKELEDEIESMVEKVYESRIGSMEKEEGEGKVEEGYVNPFLEEVSPSPPSQPPSQPEEIKPPEPSEIKPPSPPPERRVKVEIEEVEKPSAQLREAPASKPTPPPSEAKLLEEKIKRDLALLDKKLKEGR